MHSSQARRTQRKSDATRHVRDLLRVQALADGFSDRGGALPSEAELMLEFGATRNVVREALGLLRDEGLIERLQGAGTFVIAHKLLHRFDILHGAAGGYPNRHQRVRGELRRLEVVPAPPFVAAKLALDAGTSVLRADISAAVDDVPYSLTTSYVSAELGEAVRHAPFNGDWYELLEHIGLAIAGTHMTIESVLADEFVGPWLGILPGAPIVLFTRSLHDSGDRPIEYGFVRVRADRLMLHVNLERRPTAPGKASVVAGEAPSETAEAPSGTAEEQS